MKSSLLVLAIGLVLMSGAAAPAAAQDGERSAAAEFGLGVSSLALTLPYGLAKLVYALGGSVTGGLAWALTGGRFDIARAIIQPAVRGDYVITPEHLTNNRALVFIGREPDRQPSYSY